MSTRKAIVTTEEFLSFYPDGEPKEEKETVLFTFPYVTAEAEKAFAAACRDEKNKGKTVCLWYFDDAQTNCLGRRKVV